MDKIIKIGTRGSQLALYQANAVKNELEKKFLDYEFIIEIIKTKGDKILDVALSKIGDKGLFTKEIEKALTDGEIDMAIHSLKDLPTVLPDDLEMSGVLKRGEFRDALINTSGKKLNELDSNDIIATSSLRRKAQLLAIKPNFNIVDIRGNVNTRLQKMESGHCTSMIMAAAGLQRIGLQKYISEIIDKDIIIPAVSQGIIAIETRKNDLLISRLIHEINDSATYAAALAERKFLNVLEGGCQIPIGTYTDFTKDTVRIKGFISLPNGEDMIKGEISGKTFEAEKLAEQLALSFIEKGASEIIKFMRTQSE